MSVQASQQITITDITDAYYVALTSEAYTFMGNTSGAPSGLSCTTQAVAYCGTKVCSKVTIGSITCPTGISAAITNNNTVSPTITFKTTGTITASCEAIIPISVDGVTINKKFSFAVAKTGATGEKGDKGNTGAAGQDGEDGQMLYATCSTAAGTKAKTAALSSGTLSLKTGSTVSVKFTYANTAASPTLNVAGTGAKTIRVNGATMTAAYYWVAGAVITFVYDGTYWNVSDAGALKKVEDAAKTATDFLKFENNGLIVGNMTGSTLGNNVLIDSDSVDIRNGDTVLASYGADVIYLGKGKKDTMIDICDGTGIIKRDVYENTDYFVVGRNNPSNNPNIYFATNEIGIRMYSPSSVSYDDGKEAIIRMFGTKGSGTISIMSDIIDISGWTVNINGYTDVKVNGDSLISKLTSLQSSITALQNKSYVELLNYSWGGFILRVWGVGHVRYFTIKGTMTQTLSSGVQINQRPSLIPVSGFTCFERGGFSIAVNTVNGQGAFVSDSTWKAGDYINIAGCYFATTRV